MAWKVQASYKINSDDLYHTNHCLWGIQLSVELQVELLDHSWFLSCTKNDVLKNSSNETQKIVFSKCLGVLRVFVLFCVFFVYGPFCHVALKLDMSTLFTTIFLWTSLQFILMLKTFYSRYFRLQQKKNLFQWQYTHQESSCKMYSFPRNII